MQTLATLFSKTEKTYTGPELRPHFLLTELGLRGSALAAFVGPCAVQTDHLVDWEDRLASDRIEARRMVHFLGEFFGIGLREGVYLQRLFMASLGELVNEHWLRAGGASNGLVWREGDDLYVGPRGASDGAGVRKLSVSIVTASPVSVLLHAGINIDPAGAPVPAVGLQELGIQPELWVPEALSRFAAEYEGIGWATAKVRPVV